MRTRGILSIQVVAAALLMLLIIGVASAGIVMAPTGVSGPPPVVTGPLNVFVATGAILSNSTAGLNGFAVR